MQTLRHRKQSDHTDNTPHDDHPVTQHSPWRDPRKHPWGNKLTASLAIALAATLFVMYPNRSVDSPAHLTVGTPNNIDTSLSADYRPPTEALHQQIAQQFVEFRALNRQQRTDIDVYSMTDSPALSNVVANLTQWLNTHQLRSGTGDQSVSTTSALPVQIFHAPKQQHYAQEFARSLAPYINTQLALRSDSSLSPGELNVTLHVAPTFSDQGHVYWR